MADQYDRWTKESLIRRVRLLEEELKKHSPLSSKVDEDQRNQPAAPPPGEDAAGDDPSSAAPAKKQKKKKKIDPSKYSTRLVALKLAYLGKRYNGFEFQNTAREATIEEELWKALVKSCLIFPENPEVVDFSKWEYSKCGRTDRGVSAFGQVIGIRVRSNRPVPKEPEPEPEPVAEAAGPLGAEDAADGAETEAKGQVKAEASTDAEAGPGKAKAKKREWDPIADEIEYCRVLNGILPPDIRILAWCPNLPPDFSARFACRERQYRYFFTQPAYAPLPSSVDPNKRAGVPKDGWLDIDAMRKAAKLYEGLHDFRNFCKVDPNKQITNFWRRIFECDIVEVKDIGSALPYLNGPDFRPETLQQDGDTHPKVYYFHVRGSAFLWHQIRHMVAVIFSVGQGYEPPSIVSDLLDAAKTPRRPGYTMTDEVPLVLWDCIFPELPREEGGQQDMHSAEVPHLHHVDAMDWIWMGEDKPSNLFGSHGLADQLWEQWRERKMDEILANQLLGRVAVQADLGRGLQGPARSKRSDKVFDGGNSGRQVGTYVPMMKKPMLPSPEEVNDKFARSKGFASSAEMTKTKHWRAAMKAAKNGDAGKGGETPSSTPGGPE